MVEFILIAGFMVGIVLVVAVIGRTFERRRVEQLRAEAARMGLDFTPVDETGLQAGFAGFHLFGWGRAKRVSNIAYGRVNGEVEVMLFDYRYTTGSGKSQRTNEQTVAFVQSDALHLPEFVARPEGLFDKIGQVFGYQDIDLPMHPEFSRRYILRGQDEAAIRDFFPPEVARFFEINPGLSIEAKPDRFILYRPGKRLKPEDWRGWMELGLRTCDVFRGR